MTLASAGLFNCTVGGALIRRGALPDHGGPRARDAGEATDIQFRGRAARLRRPVRVTLDGIAKGYAVDVAVAALRRHGIAAGWINAGGDLRAFGALTLPVHRREADGTCTNLGGLRHAALTTSQVAPTYRPQAPGLIVNGSSWRASVPASRPYAASVVSVLARVAWRADALTKVAALAPPAARASLVNRLGGRLITALPTEAAA